MDLEPIPGQTPIDPSHLLAWLKPIIRTRAALDIAEADNIRRAMLKYLAGRRVRIVSGRLALLMRVHKDMLGRVWKYAGRLRTENLNLGLNYPLIQPALQDMLYDLEEWNKSGMDFIEQAAMLHYRCVAIHPFLGGNGRWARLMANIYLRQHSQPIVDWPDTRLADSDIRTEYITAIKKADLGYFDELIEMHRRFSAS